MHNPDSSLAVIGSGSYGTALSIAVASKGFDVTMYARDPAKAALMQEQRENPVYLKGIRFPDTLRVTSSVEEAVGSSVNLLVVVPSHFFRATLQGLVPHLTHDHLLAWATKGLDNDTGKLLSEIVTETIPFPIKMAYLSGPTFARELAMGLPTAIAVAGNDEGFCKKMCELMHTPTFRIYQNNDLIALQLGGAVKNVIAIAAGLSDGLGYGANARTALISRGLAEIVRLGLKMGASERGFTGLAGLGDLILSCTDDQSRNRRFGFMLGQNTEVQDALEKIGQVVEGYRMVPVMKMLSERYGVQMPICNELYEVIVNHKKGREAAQTLLRRALTSE